MPKHAAAACLAVLLAARGAASAADPLAATRDAVRAFTQRTAEDVTRRGPAAWRDHFADSPDFFMASEGRLVFADGASLARGLEDLIRTIAKIDLTFGRDLRVEALTPTLAMVATTWHEIRVDNAGKRVDESGYFTGLAEKGPSGWRFRNAHWSVSVPAAAP